MESNTGERAIKTGLNCNILTTWKWARRVWVRVCVHRLLCIEFRIFFFSVLTAQIYMRGASSYCPRQNKARSRWHGLYWLKAIPLFSPEGRGSVIKHLEANVSRTETARRLNCTHRAMIRLAEHFRLTNTTANHPRSVKPVVLRWPNVVERTLRDRNWLSDQSSWGNPMWLRGR